MNEWPAGAVQVQVGSGRPQVVRQLADPRPRDHHVLDELDRYRDLAARWHDWQAVADVLAAVAEAMVSPEGER